MPAALAERVPAEARSPGDERGAVTLAASEARCHNRSRALQALDVAQALDPDLHDAAYVQLRARLREKVPAA